MNLPNQPHRFARFFPDRSGFVVGDDARLASGSRCGARFRLSWGSGYSAGLVFIRRGCGHGLFRRGHRAAAESGDGFWQSSWIRWRTKCMIAAAFICLVPRARRCRRGRRLSSSAASFSSPACGCSRRARAWCCPRRSLGKHKTAWQIVTVIYFLRPAFALAEGEPSPGVIPPAWLASGGRGPGSTAASRLVALTLGPHAVLGLWLPVETSRAHCERVEFPAAAIL